MDEWISFQMNDFLGTAGIIGLLKILKKVDFGKENYKMDDTSVKVKTEFLLETDLTQAYFDTLIDVYQEECPYNKILNQINVLIMEPDKQDKEFTKQIKSFKKALESNRYKTGYKAIQNTLDISVDLYETLNQLILLKANDEINKILHQIHDILYHKTVKETFFMKDIAYFIINNFWDSKSFLNRNNVKKDMKKIHRKEIEMVLKQYLKSKSKSGNICVECGEEVSSKFSQSSSFVNDFSEDFARKNSNYWNFKPNCYFCPKCLFLYTLVPLGFRKVGQNFLFINSNSSLKLLESINEQKMTVKKVEENNNYGYLYNQILQNLNIKNLEQISNIQVITRLGVKSQYRFNIINKKTLLLLNACRKELELLSKYGYIKDAIGNRNIYEEVLLHLLYNQELYRLLNELLRFHFNVGNEYVIYTCNLIYRIEERRKEMIGQKNYYGIAKKGQEYRKEMERNGKDDATIGISYKMLNALKCHDCNQFLDIVIRLSNSLKRKVPSELINALSDIEEFKKVGYGFVLGFRGGCDKSSEKLSEE